MQSVFIFNFKLEYIFMKNKISIAALSFAAVLSSTAANACDCHNHKKETGFYVGLEGGLSAPIINTFKKKMEVVGQKVPVKGHLSNSLMYGALLGYKFYPGMAAEFSYQHKPKYKMNVTIPNIDMFGTTAQKNSSKVKVSSDLYLLGMVYDLSEIKGFTPYIGVEVGVANIKVKNQSFYSNVVGLGSTEIVRVKKSSSITPAAQLSLGFTRHNIVENVSIYTAARVQLIMDTKLKYEVLLPTTEKGSFKTKLLIGEVVMGLTYDLPF